MARAVGHAGLTNAFHDNDLTPFHLLAKTAPNQANIKGNEYFHLKITREVLLGETGLLSAERYGPALRAEVDSLVETLIRATDPATQSNYLQVLRARMAQEPLLSASSTNRDDRTLVSYSKSASQLLLSPHYRLFYSDT